MENSSLKISDIIKLSSKKVTKIIAEFIWNLILK
jgi:hypothetical protein